MTSWARAYGQFRPTILGYLTRRLRHRQDAEDLCQETFARVMRAPRAPDEEPRLRAYLLRTAHNLLCSHVRRARRLPLAAELPDGDRIATLADPHRLDPVDALIGKALAARLQALIAELPDEQRVAFELGVLGRRPYAQIVRRTGWSLAKVKVTVYRARRRLLAGLREEQ